MVLGANGKEIGIFGDGLPADGVVAVLAFNVHRVPSLDNPGEHNFSEDVTCEITRHISELKVFAAIPSS